MYFRTQPAYALLRGFFLSVSLVATGLFAPLALAIAPSFTGQPLTVPFPQQPGDRVVVNLRVQSVVIGSPSLKVGTGQGNLIIDGQATSIFQVNSFGDVEGSGGAVCVEIVNVDSGPLNAQSIEAQWTVSNAQGTDGAIVRLINGAAQVVDPENAQACLDFNQSPVANAGPDQNLVDANADGVESVTLDGRGSTDADGQIDTYQWIDLATEQQLATGVNPTITLPTGSYDILLIVTDDSKVNASDSVRITIQTAALQANAGPDQTVNDTDGAPGETVRLDASGSTGDIDSYEWFLGEQSLGTTAVLDAKLPDGVSTVTLVVRSFDGEGSISDSDDVQITVNPPAPPGAPVANAGVDQTLSDSDQQPGESVTLDGSASTTPAETTIVSYDWYLQTGIESRDLLGSGVTLTTSLPDGVNTVILEIANSAQLTSSDTVQISIAAPSQRAILSAIPNLTPNQQRMANALDSLCSRVLVDDTAPTPSDQQTKPAAAAGQNVRAAAAQADLDDLTTKCRGLLFNNTTANQVSALDELSGDDFAAARTQTLLFANFQYAGVLDRLMALRGGARGLSLAGLNIMIDGQPVPLATLQSMVKDLFGGGAASDADEMGGGLLSDKWGMWARGNYSAGRKASSAASPSFDADQFAFMFGMDYRLSDMAVVGGSLAYGDSSVEFNPSGEGALDTASWALSLYGSMYAAKNFYLDALFNLADSSFDANRNISYADGLGLVNEDAQGDTGGLTLSGGLSGGYDFLLGGLTLSPNLGFFYVEATIDGFTESGAGGLNLIYDEQNFKSLTANAGFRATYAWNLPWGVLLPHLRVDFVREFEDDVDVFGVRFASDPNANSIPPILIETDNPDTSYWRLATGLSAQFRYGFSGYVEYQRLESFQFITFHDISMGLRMQKSF